MNKEIELYHNQQTASDKLICDLLYTIINNHLEAATHKVWHGHPVWFINDNPIVGHSKQIAGKTQTVLNDKIVITTPECNPQKLICCSQKADGYSLGEGRTMNRIKFVYEKQ